jgi:putative PIG3 family NAD(P)H quinone oxidoreductase
MKAIVVKRDKQRYRLAWEEVPDVKPGPDEVLIDVKATAVNRADLLQAMGLYPPPPGESEILGLEMAGVVAAIGPRVKGRRIGDRVIGLLSGGGYAQQVAIHPQLLLELPDSWSYLQGAAIPEVWLTAYSNLFMEAALQSGQTVMIHAGGSGVGTAGIQMAREADATVYVTAGTAAKLKRCRELGASLGVNYKQQDFVREVMAITRGQGVDVILDPIGGAYLNQNLALLKENGCLVNIGLLGGTTAEINLGAVLGKSLRIIGTRLRSRPLAQKIEITRIFADRFWSIFETGRLQPIVDSVFEIQDAHAAHDYVKQNKNTGKVVLEISSPQH